VEADLYRRSFDTVERALQQLRTENERLRADVASALRLTRPRRWIRVGGAVAWLALLAAAGVSAFGYGSASLDLQSHATLDDACASKLGALTRELQRRSRGVRGRFEQGTLKRALHHCYAQGWWSSAQYCSYVVWDSPYEAMPWDTCVCR
jgi:hypothetical protein